MTVPPKSNARIRRIGVIVLVLFTLIASGALLFYNAVQSTPLEVGSVRAEDATAETTAAPELMLNGEAAFISDRDGNWEVYVIESDASAPRNITNHPKQDWFPSYALNGEKLTILSDRTGEAAPVLTNPDGTGTETLSILGAITTLFGQGLLDWDPQYPPPNSAVDSALLWVSLRDFNLEVYVLPDTATPDAFNRYTAGFAYDWFPAWSPDGAQIIFTSERDGNLEIYLTPSAFSTTGADQTRLTDNAVDDLYAVWSLAGDRLLFVSERERLLTDGFLDLYVMNPDGSAVAALGETVFEGDPSWSPDGTQMLYMSNRDGDFELYLRDSASGAERQLTDNEYDDLFPIWRP